MSIFFILCVMLDIAGRQDWLSMLADTLLHLAPVQEALPSLIFFLLPSASLMQQLVCLQQWLLVLLLWSISSRHVFVVLFLLMTLWQLVYVFWLSFCLAVDSLCVLEPSMWLVEFENICHILYFLYLNIKFITVFVICADRFCPHRLLRLSIECQCLNRLWIRSE